MVVTLQQIGAVVKDYITQKLASSYTGLKRAGLYIGAELVAGYIVNKGMMLKHGLTVGAGLFTDKNNVNLDKAKEYLKSAMQNCGPFSIELPFNLPVVTIEPSDVDELYNVLRPMAVPEI
jgi:hypothetical protein